MKSQLENGVLGPVHTETYFPSVFVLFTVLKEIENNQLITSNNIKTQENVSEPQTKKKTRLTSMVNNEGQEKPLGTCPPPPPPPPIHQIVAK